MQRARATRALDRFFDEQSRKVKRCIVHRDLKSENVLVSEFTVAKVADFGCSRAMDAGVTMTAVGTPLFAAPEMMRGEHFTEAVDAYSFGVLLVDCATEEPLVDFFGQRWASDFHQPAPDPTSIVYRRLVLGAVWDKDWRPVGTQHGRRLKYAPQTINALVVRCCDPDPERRPTFEAVLRELSKACAAEGETEGPFYRAPFFAAGTPEPTASAAAAGEGGARGRKRQPAGSSAGRGGRDNEGGGGGGGNPLNGGGNGRASFDVGISTEHTGV